MDNTIAEHDPLPTGEKPFINKQVLTEDLPDFGDIDFEKIHPNYRKSGLVLCSVLAAIALIAVFVIRFGFGKLEGYLFLIPLGVITLIYLLLMLFTYFSYDKQGFAIRTHDILYKHGLFWRSTMIIPFSRVQHAEIDQGPIDRFFDLTQLKIFTAGGTSSDLSIPGLKPLQANKLKELIIVKSGADEEE